MGSEITDDTVEPLAYAVCNTDGVEGLAWAEVEQCEVSKNKYKDLELESLACVEVKYLEVEKTYLKDTSCFCSNFHQIQVFLIMVENVNFAYNFLYR